MTRHRPAAAATCGRFGTAGVAAGLAMTCRELSEAGVGVRFATGGVVVGLSRVASAERLGDGAAVAT